MPARRRRRGVRSRSSTRNAARRFVAWIAAGALLGAAAATVARRLGWPARRPSHGPAQVVTLARLIVWFTWPAWLLALWTLWRWRRHLRAGTSRCRSLRRDAARAASAMGGSRPRADAGAAAAGRARGVRAADAAAQRRRGDRLVLGVLLHHRASRPSGSSTSRCRPACRAQPAANVARLSPGFTPTVLGARPCASRWPRRWPGSGWCSWRTGRHRHPLWKSLVLPAGGVAICWLLVMTLLLPPLDNARSYRSMVQRIARQVPARDCIAAPGHGARTGRRPRIPRRLSRRRGAAPPAQARCELLMLTRHRASRRPRRGSSSARERRNTQRRRRHRHLPARRAPR